MRDQSCPYILKCLHIFLTSQLLIHYVSLLMCLCPVALSTAIDISCLPCSCGLCCVFSCSSAFCLLFFGGGFIFLVFPLTPRFLFPFHPPYEQARPSLIPPKAPSTGHPASIPVVTWVQEDLRCHTPSENTGRAVSPPVLAGKYCSSREARKRKEDSARGATTASASWPSFRRVGGELQYFRPTSTHFRTCRVGPPNPQKT